MRILLIAPEYPPFHIGGGGEVFASLTREYLALGHHVSVVYGYYQTSSWFEPVKSFVKDGVRFYQMPEMPVLGKSPILKIRMPLNMPAIAALGDILEKEHPDIVHLHGYGFAFSDIAAVMLWWKKIPYILTIHGWPMQHRKSNLLLRNLIDVYLKIFSGFTLEKAAAITCVSRFLKGCLQQKYQNKTSVIYNGLASTVTDPRKVNLHKLFGIGKDGLVIISLGRISYIKGFQKMLPSLSKLQKRGKKVAYLIAGEDEGYKSELERLIFYYRLEKVVHFVGSLDNKQKYQYMRAADCVAIPSVIEGFGLVAIEAASLNKVVLVGQSQAVKEVLTGYSKTVSLSAHDLFDAINEKKKSSEKFDLSKFSYKTIAKKYIDLLVKNQK